METTKLKLQETMLETHLYSLTSPKLSVVSLYLTRKFKISQVILPWSTKWMKFFQISQTTNTRESWLLKTSKTKALRNLFRVPEAVLKSQDQRTSCSKTCQSSLLTVMSSLKRWVSESTQECIWWSLDQMDAERAHCSEFLENYGPPMVVRLINLLLNQFSTFHRGHIYQMEPLEIRLFILKLSIRWELQVKPTL